MHKDLERDFMESIEEKKKWLYQNFNMGTELDIAGGFIFDGIKKIHEMAYFGNNYETFSALYNIAVGIERLQKIVIVLWGLDDTKDYGKFGNSFKHHKHTSLRDRINSELLKSGNIISFSKDENDIIELLQNFYNSARYARYNYGDEWDKEVNLLRTLLEEKNLLDKDMQEFNDSVLYLVKDAKDFFGSSIGSISRKYYKVIEEGSRKIGTYTYETEYGSKAQKIFLKSENDSISLISNQELEAQVLKEIFVIFRNLRIKDPFMCFVDEIEPLELDPAEIPYYLNDIIKGRVSQDLIDAVQSIYDDMDEDELDNRKKLLSCLGNLNMDFEAKYSVESFQIIKRVYEDGYIEDDELVKLNNNIEYIRDDYLLELIKSVIRECNNFIDTKACADEFRHNLDKIFRNADFEIVDYLNMYSVNPDEEDGEI